MIDLTESLLKAISIVADRSAEEVASDKTIKVAIKKNISTSEGKYLVTYNGGDFYAYTQSGSKDIYEENEQVYLLLPEGDMSQKKFIIGKVEGEKNQSEKILNSSLLNDYVLLGDNAVIEKGYGLLGIQKMQPLHLNSYKVQDYYYCYLRDKNLANEIVDENNNIIYNTSEYPIIDIDEESFSNSAKQAKALLLRANFKASLDTNSIGNYGFIVNIAFADKTNPQTDEDNNVIYPPKLVAYVLDTNKMTGNPEKFYDYTSQYTISNFDGENYLYIDSIIAFSEGFVEEEIKNYDNEIIDPYIYFDNIEIIALNEISAVNGDYKLRLSTPKGSTVKEGKKDSLEVAATVTYLNQDITKDTVFYWGARDPLITSSHEKYNAKLGLGYRCLDEKNSKIIVDVEDLTAIENNFICVAVYESDIILKASVTLYNNNNNLKITIDSDQGTVFQFNEGNPILTCLINDKTENFVDNYPDDGFVFVWTKEDSEFGNIILDKSETQLEIEKEKELQQCRENTETHLSDAGRSVSQILSYYSTMISQVRGISYPDGIYKPKIQCKLKNTNDYVTYSCSVYRADIYVGYGSITLQNSKNIVNNNYYVTITNGAQVFQYDENGVAPNSQKQKNPIEVLNLTAVFHSPQGAIVTPKKVRWIVPENSTLINIPSIGLETDINTGERFYEGEVYPLSIKDIYDSSCTNNQITAIVTHIDGTEYRQVTDLLFTKVGEIGTNGTSTVLKIDELINVPTDECLTIIKNSEEEAFYNEGSRSSDTILEAKMYTNNAQTLGHSTTWSIAGGSNIQAYKYKVEKENNACKVTYDGNENALDVRIIKAQADFEGKTYSSFYGIPAIEYAENYNYDEYPIKIMRDKTLKTVLYDSSGNNPSYDENKGVHIEFGNWDNDKIKYLEWSVESGVKIDGEYENPNLLLSRTPKQKIGSKELKIELDMQEIQSFILETQSRSEDCAEGASPDIKKYINKFLVDVEKIAGDNILLAYNKNTILWNRLNNFIDKAPEPSNIFIQRVYEMYKELFLQIEEELTNCREINEENAAIYNKIQQNIWKSEWPSVITEDRLHTSSLSSINSIEKLIEIYQQAYDDRSNDLDDAIKMPARKEIFDSDFRTVLDEMDRQYKSYVGVGENKKKDDFNPILVEYAKILIGYISLLVNETSSYFNNNDDIKSKYSFINKDWEGLTSIIGENIYGCVSSTLDENIASIYTIARALYKYYQKLYLSVKRTQIAEESKTLNAWNSLLNGEQPDLLKQIYVIPNESFNGLYMNNNVVGTVFIKENGQNFVVAKIYVPIIMTLNTYELSALNGWDGTSIEIGDDHIMTPQIGAGIKDEVTNTFTGMVMGALSNMSNEDNSSTAFESKIDENNAKVGLIGYSNGKQSVFIDSITGKATFGLPEDDSNLTNEGRIVLNPGGVSKIGNWKIGNRFLYNIVDGTYERRSDADARNNKSKNKLMVPHNKHGIILSSDQPYIHVKGEVYDEENITGINYEDEYNNINPEDSLELRIDPGDKSLFSIVQHTSGFGDEDIEDLHFGYKDFNSDSITVIRNYVANQNTPELNQAGGDSEYYIYRLDYKLQPDEDGNLIAKPFYNEENEATNYFSKINSDLNPWKETFTFTILDSAQNNISLNWALTKDNFKKTTTTTEAGPVFSIDSDSGLISYNPNNLIWDDDSSSSNGSNIVGFSNNDGWYDVTGRTSTEDDFLVETEYQKYIDTSIIKDETIGQIRNKLNYKIYQIRLLNSKIYHELENIVLNSANDGYAQFYVVTNKDYTIEQALLKSEEISLWSNYDDLNIELFSFNNNYISKNQICYLKLQIRINSYTIDGICSNSIKKKIISYYKTPPVSPYGTVKITNAGASAQRQNFTVANDDGTNITGQYWVSSNNNFYLFVNNNEEYDFVLWKQGEESSSRIGRAFGNGKHSRFCTSTTNAIEEEKLDYFYEGFSQNSTWYINFYSPGTYVEDIFEYVDTESGSSEYNTIGTQEASIYITKEEGTLVFNTRESVSPEKDNIDNDVTVNSELKIKYRAIVSSVDFTTYKNTYAIDWSVVDSNYDNIKISWGLKTNLEIGNILGLTPSADALSNKRLCVQENDSIQSLQGIPYAKTYWYQDENNGNEEKWVILYKEYYQWVNSDNNNKSQYGYIDIIKNDNIYYKYIKTFRVDVVNNWFKNGGLEIEHGDKTQGSNVFDWIGIPVDRRSFKDNLYWKEFIRVGLDENGRFFSAGFQDKKTYSRTGKIYAFGKVPDLYGQEIRTQKSLNDYTPILKIFSKMNDINTTYITQGTNDNGNISIRTSGTTDNYIELATSKKFENNNATIPEKTTYIRVSSSNGIEIQAENDSNLFLLTSKKLDIKNEGNISLSSTQGDIILKNNGDKSVQIKSLSYKNTSKENNPGDKEDENNYGYHEISAGIKIEEKRDSSGNVIKDDNGNAIKEKKPEIKLGIVPINNSRMYSSLIIDYNKVELHFDNSFLSINKDSFKINSANKMNLEFINSNDNESQIDLKNGNSNINLKKFQSGDRSEYSIELNVGTNNQIAITNKIILKASSGIDIQSNNMITMTARDIKMSVSGSLSLDGILNVGTQSEFAIRMYSKNFTHDNSKKYLVLKASDLEKMLYWYNHYRWGMALQGNTLFIRKTGRSTECEGSWDSSTQTWKWNFYNIGNYLSN